MTLEEMKARKKELHLTNQMIADASGVPLGTVQKIFAGLTGSPRLKTIEALEAVLSRDQSNSSSRPSSVRPAGSAAVENSAQPYGSAAVENSAQPYGSAAVENSARPTGYAAVEKPYPGMLKEGSAAYAQDPAQGSYTIADYYALPDDRRVELIDGRFYDMASPSQLHQIALGELFAQLYPCVLQHPPCRIFIAPLDVCLDNDDWTIVQPDLLITCQSRDQDSRRINGAPDFIIEIVSPSSRFHDMFRKLSKYRQAGVREYWIVDPEKQKVTVYYFEGDELPDSYNFGDTVSLRISHGSCSVDFRQVSERIRQYLG